MVCERVARQANLEIHPPRIGVVSLTSHGLNIVGESNVCFTFDGIKHETAVLVASDLGEDSMLVAWHDLQPLEIISPNFPARISVALGKELALDIMKEFPNVFREKLGELPMNVPKMKIVLSENAVLFRVSRTRQVPLRFQSAANKTVDDLVRSKVIIPEDDPQDWYALGFFVPKLDGINVRMVTDYSKINKFVKRPVHPFPSVADIVRSIPAGTRFFAKIYAIHGYFQLALDEESSKLTTFLLPSGRYRYLRASMGLSSSSDEWCRYSDRAIQGLPFTRKIVDDILVWGSLLPELYERIRVIAARCNNLNIALSKRKFVIGSEISFAGLLLTEKRVKPDPARILALSDFPVPKDVTGVRSFLGLVNQLSGFIPDFAHMSVHLRALTAKKTRFCGCRITKRSLRR